MRGCDVQAVFESVLPNEALDGLIGDSDLQLRERKLEAKTLIRSAVIAAASGQGGRQAAVLRQYFEMGAARVVRGSAYGWFGDAFEQVMEGVSARALDYARTQPTDLPGVLGRHVKDWRVVDSSTVKLSSRLIDVYPGTGDYAALKVHKTFSIGVGTTVDYHLSPAREHDSRHLTITEDWRDMGLLIDLGYASIGRLNDCERHGVKFVIRLKNSWKPRVQSVEMGKLAASLCKGTDLDFMLADGILELDGQVVDATVEIGGRDTLTCRMVGTLGPKGYCWYLTNLPADVSPDEVRQLYAIRWEIELDNKLDKSCNQLDRIGAETPSTVRALVHASVVASMMVCLLAHHHRLEEGGPAKNRPYRAKPPIHPQTLGRMVATASHSIAAALGLRDGPEANDEWDRIASMLLHCGTDPNWRNRPSVLDQMRGWKIRPGKKRLSKAQNRPK
jgi:hypothetical protein